MKRVLVTGATGFIGRFLCPRLLAEGWDVHGTLLASESSSLLANGVEPVTIEPLGAETSWNHSLTGIDAVIHLAARVHVMGDSATDPLQDYRRINTEGTRQLARAAAKAGVRRLVFVSSIKVNGEETNAPYTEVSRVTPSDPYGISKWEAEQALRQIESDTGLEIVVIRPTLVYGPGVKANFLNMMKVVSRGYPLPFASISNRRSFIYVENLVDALATCAIHPAAAGQTYLVNDGEDVSTPELIRRTASALGVPARLIPFPPVLMRLVGKLTSRCDAVRRLTGSLVVDASKIRNDLGWQPPFTMDQGIKETAQWFLDHT